jgi:hypothetical protein
LYFHDWIGLAYIELDEAIPSRISWIDYPVPENESQHNRANRIIRGSAVGDTIFFFYDSTSGGEEITDGLLSLQYTATSFDEAVQLIPEASSGDVEVDAENGRVFYVHVRDKNLYYYDITNNTEVLLLDDVSSFRICSDDQILYLGPYTVGLYLHNPNTNTSEHIFEGQSDKTGNLWSFAYYRNSDVYYRDGSKIVQYHGGERRTLYTYSPSHGGEYLYGFSFLTDNVIELNLHSETKFLINGQVVDILPERYQIPVKMADGSTTYIEP